MFKSDVGGKLVQDDFYWFAYAYRKKIVSETVVAFHFSLFDIYPRFLSCQMFSLNFFGSALNGTYISPAAVLCFFNIGNKMGYAMLIFFSSQSVISIESHGFC